MHIKATYAPQTISTNDMQYVRRRSREVMGSYDACHYLIQSDATVGKILINVK